MKTRYDWLPDRRGKLLVPEGDRSASTELNMAVYVAFTADRDPLYLLYVADRLYGQALEDAREKYPNAKEDIAS